MHGEGRPVAMQLGPVILSMSVDTFAFISGDSLRCRRRSCELYRRFRTFW